MNDDRQIAWNACAAQHAEELKAWLETSPCGKHSKMFWREWHDIDPETGDDRGKISQCTICEELKATQAAALEMAAKHAKKRVELYFSIPALISDAREAEAMKQHILSLIPPDSATALSRALDEARREALIAGLEEAKQIAITEGNTPESEGGNMLRWDACDNVRLFIRVRIDELRALTPAAPEAARPVQVSGPQCKKCGGFTTYTRVESHGLCMRCEQA